MTSLKNVKRILTAALAIIMILTVVPFSASAATNDAKEIYVYLVNDMRLTPAAACGVLANIEHESSFNHDLWGDNGTSYGICQWHNERLTNMKNYCTKNKLDWKTLYGQLSFLKYELSTNKSDTGYILDKLKNTQNTAAGAYQAGYDWCYYFERPANKADKAEKRGTKAMDTYWPKYSTMDVKSDSYTLGDVDNNKAINSVDALMIIEASVGKRKLTDTQLKAGDINRDGKVTSSDALIVLAVSAGTDKIENYK